MKIWNIILKQDEAEIFDVNCPVHEQKLIVPINISTGDTALLSTSVFRDLSSGNIVPKNNVFDLLNIALCIYTIDQVVSRTLYGYQGWSRHFKVYIPVNDCQVWNNVTSDFEQFTDNTTVEEIAQSLLDFFNENSELLPRIEDECEVTSNGRG